MEETCKDLGLSMTTAFTIFAKKMTREKRIPFDVSVDPFYSESNMAYWEKIVEDIEARKPEPLKNDNPTLYPPFFGKKTILPH